MIMGRALGVFHLYSDICSHSFPWIDIIPSTKDCSVDSVSTISSNLPLHDCVSCIIKSGKPKTESSLFSHRDYKNFTQTNFLNDLYHSNLDKIFEVYDVANKLQLYNSILTELFDISL